MMIRTPYTRCKQLRNRFAGLLVFLLSCVLVKAQLPYGETFKNSTAEGIIFGGTPIPAFLTAGPPPVPGQNGVPLFLSDGITPNAFTPAPRDSEGNGYLRLTSSNNNQKGYIFSEASFPGQKGLHIEVEYFVYGGLGPPFGADGICFFLFDGSVANSSFRIGGFGGSLGYAPKFENGAPVPGMSAGYIGVGLDEYGNFSNNDEGRFGGDAGPVLKPGSVTLRGQGPLSAAAAAPNTSTYPFLASIQTFPAFGFNLVPSGTTNGIRATDQSDPSYRKVIVDMQAIGSNPVTGFSVTTKIVVGNAAGAQTFTVLNNQVYNTPPPSLLKYGISASTGASTNVHEIRNVTITVLDPSSVTAPNAVADVVNSCANRSVVIRPADNDATPNEGGSLALQLLDLDPVTPGRQASFTVAGKGTFLADNSGNVTYTPVGNTVSGPVVINYTITDNYTQTSAPATITINDVAPPVINAGADQQITVTAVPVPNNSAALSATIPTGTIGTWSVIAQPAGTPAVSFSAASSASTNATNLAYGLYTFRFSGTNGLSCEGNDDVNVFINAIPVAVNDIVATSASTTVQIPVLDNDTDANGNNTINKTTLAIVVQSLPQPAHGSAVVDPVTGLINYTPTTGYSGDDSFLYTVRDNLNVISNQGLVIISVSVKPVGVDDVMTTVTNVPVASNIRTNDGAQQSGTTVVKLTEPSFGSVTVTPGGTATYSPNTDYHGLDQFTYALRNASGLNSDPINVSITVRPTGVDDIASTNTNTAVAIVVKANDPSRLGSTVIQKVAPQHGSITIATDGTVTYTPVLDYQGNDTFTYALRDAAALESDPINVAVTVRPAGTNDNVSTNINTPVTIPVKDNDASRVGTTVIKKTDPANGTAVLNSDGTFTYTPALDFEGTNTFRYVLRNSGNIESDEIIVTVVVKPKLSTLPDNVFTNINTQVIIAVKDNDPSAAGTTVLKQSNPAHGTATVNTDGTITFIPTTGYYGMDSFFYILRNSLNIESDNTLVTIGIRPAGTNDTYTTPLNTAITGAVKDNDVSGIGTTVILQQSPGHGTAIVNTNNTITFTPANNYSGKDVLTYLLQTADPLSSLPITVVYNIKPAGTDDAAATLLNVPVVVNVKDNDVSKLGTTVSKRADPLHGTVSLNPNASFTYTPTTGYLGNDAFTYVLSTSDGVDSDPITVSIIVSPKLSTSPDAALTNINTAVIIPVKDNDASATGATVIKQTNPANGTATVNADGTITYLPATNYYGPDSFTYILRGTGIQESDPTVVTVGVRPAGTDDAYTIPLNATIIASVKDNDVSKAGTTVIKLTNPANGTAVVNSDNTVTYTPATDYSGIDNMTYQLRTADPLLSGTITVRFVIKPTGSDDLANGLINTPLLIPVKDNDISRTNNTVVKKTDPAHGTVTVNPDGTVTYTPVPGYTGNDGFTYVLLTPDGIESNIITVSIVVNPRLSTLPDAALTNINTPVIIPVKDNDPNSSGLTVVKQSNPLHGTATVNADGTVTYVPATDYYGPDSFTYILRGTGSGESNPTLVTVGVRPSGTNDTYSTPLNTTVIASVKDNDVSKTGTTVVKQSDPLHGSAVVNSDNTITYTPVTNYSGTDNLTYVLTTADPLVSSVISVRFNIKPSGTDDAASTPMGTPVLVVVKDNDISKTGTTVVKKSEPIRGTATVNADGTASYTPAADFTGKDSFTYALRTTDGVESDLITVVINVKPIGTNDDATTGVGLPVVVKVKDNDPGRTGTTVTKKTDPLHGSVIINADGTVTYTPVAGYKGPDTFTYTLKNIDGIESDPITVTLTVRNLPVATPDIIPAVIGTPIVISVTTNDTGDGPIDKRTVTITTPPQHGTVSVNPVTGEITYTPFPGYSGPDAFSYTVKDDKGLESKPAVVTINVSSPRIGLAKKLIEVKSAPNGSYDIKYLFTIVNYSAIPLTRISLKDDLLSVFSGTVVKVIKLSHQGALTLNTKFNGTTDIEMLVPATSTLAANGEEQVELTINVKLVSRTGVFQNSAIVEGTNSNGLKVTDQSTDGLKPDPTTTGDTSPSFATLVDLNISPLFIPEGFSPNNDGINDLFVIQNTLDKPVRLEIYNRWNNLVYKSVNYQNDWDGRTTVGIHIGDYVPSGTYWYIVVIDDVKYGPKPITINR